MSRLQTRRNNSNHRSYKPNPPKEPFQEIPGAAFFLGKLNKNHDREHIYNELKKLTRVYQFYIRKLDMPYADKTRRAGNLGYAFVHTRSAAEARRIVSMKTLKLGHQVCEVKVYGGRNDQEQSSTSEAFSGRTTPEMEEKSNSMGFVNPLKIEEQKPASVWGKAKLADIVRPRIDSGCQTRNVSECEENTKIEEESEEANQEPKNHYDQDQQVPVTLTQEINFAESEIAAPQLAPDSAYSNNTVPAQTQLERDLALVRNHVGDSQLGVDLFMNYCDKIYQLLQNAPQEVILQTAQIAQIQV